MLKTLLFFLFATLVEEPVHALDYAEVVAVFVEMGGIPQVMAFVLGVIVG